MAQLFQHAATISTSWYYQEVEIKPFFHIFMVHNCILLPYQALLSPIQTAWPACSPFI